MKNRRTFLLLLLAAGMLGCGRQQLARHIVILPDVSGSIERESLEQAFKAIDGLVGHLQRGDRIAIIPILGDAQAEASGRIIRFEVPKERRAYDADLRDFQRQLGISLAKMQSNALAHPGTKTDILGSVELAAQEFAAMPGPSARLLVVLSDFIQEDGGLNFQQDHRLADHGTANQLAMHIAKAKRHDFTGVSIYLGLLRSREYGGLSRSRREAIQEFWIRYFRASAARLRFVADGSGQLDWLK